MSYSVSCPQAADALGDLLLWVPRQDSKHSKRQGFFLVVQHSGSSISHKHARYSRIRDRKVSLPKAHRGINVLFYVVPFGPVSDDRIKSLVFLTQQLGRALSERFRWVGPFCVPSEVLTKIGENVRIFSPVLISLWISQVSLGQCPSAPFLCRGPDLESPKCPDTIRYRQHVVNGCNFIKISSFH